MDGGDGDCDEASSVVFLPRFTKPEAPTMATWRGNPEAITDDADLESNLVAAAVIVFNLREIRVESFPV